MIFIISIQKKVWIWVEINFLRVTTTFKLFFFFFFQMELLFPCTRCLWGVFEITLVFCFLWCEFCVNGDVWKLCKEQCLLKPSFTKSDLSVAFADVFFYYSKGFLKSSLSRRLPLYIGSSSRGVHRPLVNSVFSSSQ